MASAKQTRATQQTCQALTTAPSLPQEVRQSTGKSLSTAEIPKSGVTERAQELEPANWVALVKPLSALNF